MSNVASADGYVGIFRFDSTTKVVGTMVPGNQATLGAWRELRRKVETSGFTSKVIEFDICCKGVDSTGRGYTYVSFGVLTTTSKKFFKALVAEFMRYLRQCKILRRPLVCPVIVPCKRATI
jgi:hypothetical protein